nr:hypothetical protein HmN_000147500 [Hymenolepis microstoma]
MDHGMESVYVVSVIEDIYTAEPPNLRSAPASAHKAITTPDPPIHPHIPELTGHRTAHIPENVQKLNFAAS